MRLTVHIANSMKAPSFSALCANSPWQKTKAMSSEDKAETFEVQRRIDVCLLSVSISAICFGPKHRLKKKKASCLHIDCVVSSLRISSPICVRTAGLMNTKMTPQKQYGHVCLVFIKYVMQIHLNAHYLTKYYGLQCRTFLLNTGIFFTAKQRNVHYYRKASVYFTSHLKSAVWSYNSSKNTLIKC